MPIVVEDWSRNLECPVCLSALTRVRHNMCLTDSDICEVSLSVGAKDMRADMSAICTAKICKFRLALI